MKITQLANLTGEATEGLRTVAIVAALLFLILAASIFSASEKSRFRRWYNRNSMLDQPMSPWRTIVPWHRAGSKWYQDRVGSFGIQPRSEIDPAVMNRLYDNVGKTLKVKNQRYLHK